MIIELTLNGNTVEADALPHLRSNSFLRDEFHCHSLKMACGKQEHCGQCLIIHNESLIHSCLLPVFNLRFSEVWTAEGISQKKGFSDIVGGFHSAGASICPSCAPSRALAIEALLRKTLRPEKFQIEETAHAVCCGCVSHSKIIEAIERAAVYREARINAG